MSASGNTEFSNYHALRRRCKRGSVYAIIPASTLAPDIRISMQTSMKRTLS